MFAGQPATEAVYIYRGLEGWKNYVRDILRIGQDDYIMGGKGAWGDPKIKSFIEQFVKEAHAKGIQFKVLIDEEARNRISHVVQILQADYKYIPKEFYAMSSFEIFGDHIVFLSDCSEGKLRDDLSITVVINQKLANSFRAWFQFMWSAGKLPK